ncbi:MAG TPA: hypothetical protein VFF48_12985 [Brevundimonas sp.]|nr:hypothetical protein [Brevundimonas sp.]
MPVLSCYVDERTHDALTEASRNTGRTVEDLAEAAISEAALASERGPTEGQLPLLGGRS